MSSTFFGLTISGSGLAAYQAALNTSANNISNVKTEGYTKQAAIREASRALRTYTSYGMAGSGVTTTAIEQLRDTYYDTKYWNNNAGLGEYDSKTYYLSQIESSFKDDDTTTGFSSIFSKMFATLSDLETNPSNESYRNQFINYASSMCDYFNDTYNSLNRIQEDTNAVLYTKVQEVNSIAQEISSLNLQINIIEQQGSKANELRDQRAVLVDELSKILPVEVKEEAVTNSNYPDMDTGATTYTIKINGHNLVSTYKYQTLEAIPRTEKVNETDVEGLYDIKWSDGSELGLGTSSLSGELKGLYDVCNGNNQDNFQGTVSKVTTNRVTDSTTGESSFISKVTISNTNQDDVDKITLASEGKITLGTKEYSYTDFTVNDDGSYTFTLTESVGNSVNAVGLDAVSGESIDYMGVPYYMQQLNEFVREFAQQFNAIHTTGIDLNDDRAGIFFTGSDLTTGEDLELNASKVTSTSDSYYKLTAQNIKISAAIIKDPSLMASTTDPSLGEEYKDVIDALKDLQYNVEMFRGGSASEFLENVLSDISVEKQKADLFSDNYQNISDIIVNKRLSISGVDEDEEAIDMVKYQNAYNLCSRMVQTMSEMYDRLITQTGV